MDKVPQPGSTGRTYFCASSQGEENTPAPTIQKRGGRSRRRSSGRKSDRGSSYERSASEPESPKDRGKRKRHPSNRIVVNKPESTSTGLTMTSSLFGSSCQLGYSRNQLFPEAQDPPLIPRRVNRIKQEPKGHNNDLPFPGTSELLSGEDNLTHLFHEMAFHPLEMNDNVPDDLRTQTMSMIGPPDNGTVNTQVEGEIFDLSYLFNEMVFHPLERDMHNKAGEILKIMNSISFQVKFHVLLHRYYETMVKNSIFRCLGLQKRLERSRKPLYNSKIFLFCL